MNINKIRQLYLKNKEVINYLIFGGLTTVISISSYLLARYIFAMHTVGANIFAWILAVTFAFITNKIWVFESRTRGLNNFLKEFTSFYAARLFTLIVDISIMYLFVDMLGFNGKFEEFIIKILDNVVVLILNYLLSKIFVFRKKS